MGHILTLRCTCYNVQWTYLIWGIYGCEYLNIIHKAKDPWNNGPYDCKCQTVYEVYWLSITIITNLCW